MEFVTGRDGEYNLCHFWSNFELGDLHFFRSKARSTPDCAVMLGGLFAVRSAAAAPISTYVRASRDPAGVCGRVGACSMAGAMSAVVLMSGQHGSIAGFASCYDEHSERCAGIQ